MSEVSGSTPEDEIRPKLLEIKKLASAETRDPLTPAVIFIPAIHGQPLTPEILDQFSQANIDLWNTQILQYGFPEPNSYSDSLAKEVKQNPEIPSVEDNLYIMGYSAGAVLAAQAGLVLNLPPEKVLLIAPAYKMGLFRRERAQAVMKRIKSAFSRNKNEGNEPGIEYIRRVLSQSETSLYGSKNRTSPIPAMKKYKEFTAWNKVQSGSQLGKNHLQIGTIFSGKNDVISPSTEHTGVGVYAGHGFKDFVPVVTQYIKTRSR
jgi:hypothetical protein